MALHDAPPATCQQGHPLVWLLAPADAFAGGEGLAACPCAARPLDGRGGRSGSQPMLWRWVPGGPVGIGSRPASLRPLFVSQNRVGFALALRLYEALLGAAAAAPGDPYQLTRRETLERVKKKTAPRPHPRPPLSLVQGGKGG